MSESDKMGLFGSKDETNASTSENNKITEKPKDNSPDHYAPYNIDSDSETYDTEALSMMDINDIIGVQADNAGDSTLESEFAALSEIITDSRDEFSLHDIDPPVVKETLNKSVTEEPLIFRDSTKKDNTGARNDEKKSSGMQSISKSLQLIGEAYISEDSQETDTDDIERITTRKPENNDESLAVSKKTENEKSLEMLLIKEIETSTVEDTTIDTNTTEAKEDPAPVEITVTSTKSSVSKSTEIVISDVSIDSCIASTSNLKVVESIENLEKNFKSSENKIRESPDSMDLSNLKEETVESANNSSRTLEIMEIIKSKQLIDSIDSDRKTVGNMEKFVNISKTTESTESDLMDAMASKLKEAEESEIFLQSSDAPNTTETLETKESMVSAMAGDKPDDQKNLQNALTTSVTEESTKPMGSRIGNLVEAERLKNFEFSKDLESTESPQFADSSKSVVACDLKDAEVGEKLKVSSKTLGSSKIAQLVDSVDLTITSDHKNSESSKSLEKFPHALKSTEMTSDTSNSANAYENFGKSLENSEATETPESAEPRGLAITSDLDDVKSSQTLGASELLKEAKITETEDSTDPGILNDSEEIESTEILENTLDESVSIEMIKSPESAENINSRISKNLTADDIEIFEKSLEDSNVIEESACSDSVVPTDAEENSKILETSNDSESKIIKSTDSTDSVTASEQLSDNIESMDVDLPSPTVNEKLSTETEPVESSERSKSSVENIVEDLEKKIPEVEPENSTLTSEETEEPMEVDEPNQHLPEIVKTDETLGCETKIIENHPENLNISRIQKSSLIDEGVDVSPEDTVKSPLKYSEKIVKNVSCEDEAVDKVLDSRSLSKKILETVDEESEPESVKSPQSEVTDAKVEMESAKESIIAETRSKFPDELIEESIATSYEENERVLMNKVESELKKIENAYESIEPMEVDIPALIENTSDSTTIDPTSFDDTAEISDTVPRITEDKETKNQEISKILTSAKNSSSVEDLKILEKLKKSPDDLSATTKLLGESAETRETDSLPVKMLDNFDKVCKPSETCEKSSDIIETITKDSFSQGLLKSSGDVEKVEKSSEAPTEIIEDVQDESSFDIALKEPLSNPHEDERMEVDGSSTKKIEESIVRQEVIETTMEEKSEVSSIDTVDDSSIATPEVDGLLNIEKSCLSEISSDKINEIVLSATRDAIIEDNAKEIVINLEEKNEVYDVIAESIESPKIIDTEITKSEKDAGEKSSSVAKASVESPKIIYEEIPKTEDIAEEKSSFTVEVSEETSNIIDTEIPKSEDDAEEKSAIFGEVAQSEDENLVEPSVVTGESVNEKNEENEKFEKEEKAQISLENRDSLKCPDVEDATTKEKILQESIEIEDEREMALNKYGEEFSIFSESAESANEKNSEFEDAELSTQADREKSEKNDTELPREEKEKSPILEEKANKENEDDSNLLLEIFQEEVDAKADMTSDKMDETLDEEIFSNQEKEENQSEEIISNENEEETLSTDETAVSSEKIEENSNLARETLTTEEEKKKSISAENKNSFEDEKEIFTENAVKVEQENSVLSESMDITNEEQDTSPSTGQVPDIDSTSDENDSSLQINNESTISTEARGASSFNGDDIFSKPKVPRDESNLDESSIDPIDDASKEDPIEDEMNLSLDPETIETPEHMILEADEEIEDHVEMNLSLDPDEKDEEMTSHQIEECSEEMEKREENYVETTDKTIEDIMSTRNDRVTEIFHDDEQSQSTQEMMESILETDKGNINKILDDEEAVGDALERRKNLETSEIEDIAEKLPNESDELLSKALDDPITSQNIDSLEGLLDLDLMPENDEPTLKSVEPIVDKVMKDSDDDIETIDKNVDVSMLMEDTEQNVEDVNDENSQSVDDLIKKSNIAVTSGLIDNDLEAFDLNVDDPNPLESQSEDPKMDLAEDLLRDIAVDEERKMELAKELLLESGIQETDLLLSSSIPQSSKIGIPDEVFLDVADEAVEPDMELSEDISLESAVRDQVLNEVAAEIENMPQSSEISELESAVKFLQESEEHEMDSPLVLSPKMVERVVEDITTNSDVVMFSDDGDICDDPTELVTELESIIPDPIAISEAEIINEAAKLESERKTKMSEEIKSQSPNEPKTELSVDSSVKTPPIRETSKNSSPSIHTETPKTHREPREKISKSPEYPKIEHESLKKSAPIPKISILEERLKVPPKIEIPQGEISRVVDCTPTTSRTSLLIQRDSKSFQKMLESPKTGETKGEHKIVDTPRKDVDKYDVENVGSPRIILKIAKSAIADCAEPRSPKSPKIRSATNSPNPEDSPGQKLGKIKLKLSKGGHPSIIPNDNVDELCGQWHTEGSSSLSPLGMKIKFSKIADTTNAPHPDKHDEEIVREQPKHKFEEAKRTESPIGMKIKLSRTGEPSIIQHESKDGAMKHKDKLDIQDSPKRTESPIGMKIKLSKSGDASIIQPDKQEIIEEHRESRSKERSDPSQQHPDKNDTPRRTESPLGIKLKLFKTGDASIMQSETSEDTQQEVKRTDSPLGMKIKLSKTRSGASIVTSEMSDEMREKNETPEVPRRTESPLGMKIKLSKSGDASIIHTEEQREFSKHRTELMTQETTQLGELQKRQETTMKIKLSKSGDASIVHPEESIEESRVKEKTENLVDNLRKTDSSIGMKIKFSKTGDATIIPPQIAKKSEETSLTTEMVEVDNSRSSESVAAMKIKLQKSGDGSIVEIDKKEKSTRRKDAELPIEMKIKISKTGHPTIVACENYGDTSQRGKDCSSDNQMSPSTSKHKEPSMSKEIPGMKSILKSMQSANLQVGRSELTIEPVQLQQPRKSEINDEFSQPKRKDITISPIESKKTKIEAKLSHILPEVTIQPIVPREQKKMMFDAKAASISRQQMNVISQEISITQVRSSKPVDITINDKLKSMLKKNPSPSRDCEIIEHRPELIIVNENSNSSQDVMIIEEVPAIRVPEVKTPKKRGRPRRNPLPIILAKPTLETANDPVIPRDPLALDDVPHIASHIAPQTFTPSDNEAHGRPKRTCRSQKSYAPPRRGRGRGGRGKRKMDMDHELSKRPRIEQDLDMIERSTTALITIHEPPAVISHGTSELYKALRQPTMDRKMPNAIARVEAEHAVNETRNNPDIIEKDRRESLMDARIMSHLDGVIETSISKKSTNDETFEKERKLRLVDANVTESQDIINKSMDNEIMEVTEKSVLLTIVDKIIEKIVDEVKDNRDTSGTTNDQENWLTPSSKKQLDGRNEANISNVQVMDEETRMSAESVSRSQTPAKNISVQAPETIVNEESQGSVLSTATTESEKVKAKTRRMEITLDPDEGPFTVDRVAEYDWPLDPMRKTDSFMIQEQISQYLGVKSFKRKYPDLKRRMVDMEERNYLRENGLVSEAMCDMGLTAVCSSEVLDVMCSDFPDQYEEYRKYIREKQMKEHLKKQKELTAAANAEKNRIDLAEMAVQSALTWNVGLNKARRESRKCSLDLQTFTIHVPKKQQKIEEEDRGNHYPVALIPGQYTDYYREYTPAELRYYPLNTVLYGPMKPNERKFDSQSEGSQSDSDSDSSSDDSSSSSSEGTQDTEASQSTMDDADVELSRQKEDMKNINCKMCLKHLNKFTRMEVLIQCGTCNGYVHPSCIDLTLDMVPHIQAYAWQCTDCKTCAQCHDPADEDKMLFCDMCDRGYHIYCVGLRRVPQGRWHCQECAVCASCGSREAGGANSDRNSVAQWQHEYKKGDKNTRVYVSTLCVPCSKLSGDQGSDNRQEKLSV